MGIETALAAVAGGSGLINAITGGGGGSSTKQVGGIPSDIAPLRQALVNFLIGTPGTPSRVPAGGSFAPTGNPVFDGMRSAWANAPGAGTPGKPGVDFNNLFTPDIGTIAGGPDSFFMNHLLAPYQQMFDAQRSRDLAQAKEQAGNLSGSGYNNLFGDALNQSLGNEQGMLAQVMQSLLGQELTRRQNNASNLLSLLLGLGTSGVGPGQVVTQPGPLDYISQAAGTIGSILNQKDKQKGNS